MNPDECNARDFRVACSRFPTGVTVTTLMGTDGQPHGVTLNSFTSVSLTPPLVLVCIDHRSPIICHLRRDGPFAINILGAHQQELSIQFSRQWEERFTGVPWHPGATGAPILFDVPAVFECTLTEMITAGDHEMVLGRVLHVLSTERVPLAYLNSRYGQVLSKQRR